jgi:hypothetical protein
VISFVTSDLDPSVLLAIAHRIVKAGGRSVFAWNDTVRWRAVEVQRVDAHTEERIEFVPEMQIRAVVVVRRRGQRSRVDAGPLQATGCPAINRLRPVSWPGQEQQVPDHPSGAATRRKREDWPEPARTRLQCCPHRRPQLWYGRAERAVDRLRAPDGQ